MKNLQALYLKAAAVQGFSAIAFGAFGAHGLGRLTALLHPAEAAARLDWVRTGAHYQQFHAAALLALAALSPRLVPGAGGRLLAAFLAGPLLFALPLYGLALGGPLWLGAVTPVGGVLMLAGWVQLAFSLEPEPARR